MTCTKDSRIHICSAKTGSNVVGQGVVQDMVFVQKVLKVVQSVTFIGGYLWYGAVPVANSIAVMPKLQMSALKSYPVTWKDYNSVTQVTLQPLHITTL